MLSTGDSTSQHQPPHYTTPHPRSLTSCTTHNYLLTRSPCTTFLLCSSFSPFAQSCSSCSRSSIFESDSGSCFHSVATEARVPQSQYSCVGFVWWCWCLFVWESGGGGGRAAAAVTAVAEQENQRDNRDSEQVRQVRTETHTDEAGKDTSLPSQHNTAAHASTGICCLCGLPRPPKTLAPAQATSPPCAPGGVCPQSAMAAAAPTAAGGCLPTPQCSACRCCCRQHSPGCWRCHRCCPRSHRQRNPCAATEGACVSPAVCRRHCRRCCCCNHCRHLLHHQQQPQRPVLLHCCPWQLRLLRRQQQRAGCPPLLRGTCLQPL